MKDLTTSMVSRQNILNNNYAIDEIKNQLKLDGVEYINDTIFTKDQVAQYFNVDVRTIERCVENNKEELEKNGFTQYEISNFSISKKESKHNLKYWNCEEYLGIGPSAHSFINNKRFYYKNSLKSFINKEKPIQDGMGSDMLEYSMLKLRLSKGLKNNEFKKRFSQDIPKKYYANAKKYENCGLVIITENTIKLTRKGFIVSNELISEIIL